MGGINLSQGVVDTEVPKIVRKAVQKAIDDGINIYTRCDGLKELSKAIAFKEKTFFGESLARFCFAKKDEVLDEACDRLSKL